MTPVQNTFNGKNIHQYPAHLHQYRIHSGEEHSPIPGTFTPVQNTPRGTTYTNIEQIDTSTEYIQGKNIHQYPAHLHQYRIDPERKNVHVCRTQLGCEELAPIQDTTMNHTVLYTMHSTCVLDP